MSDKIEGHGATFRSTGGAQTEIPTETAGSWRGEVVQASGPDLASLLDAAKEELTFAHSETMEVKQLEERHIDEGRYGERVDEIEGVWKFLGHLPDLDLQALRKLLAEMEARENPTEQEVLDQVGSYFHDPSHAFAALDCAEQTFRAQGKERLAETIRAAKERFQGEHGPAIRAGMNVSVAALDISAGDRAAASELRDLYRQTVFAQPGPAAVYRGILTQFGLDGFADRVRFLTRAAGDDLAAAGPSVAPARLQQLIQDLSALRILDTVHDRCLELVGRLQRQNQIQLAPANVLQALLPLTEESVSGPAKILPLPEKLGVPPARLDASITLIRESRELLGMMPVQVFRDMDARSAVMRGMQEAMDILTEREENA